MRRMDETSAEDCLFWTKRFEQHGGALLKTLWAAPQRRAHGNSETRRKRYEPYRRPFAGIQP
jgi:hypothetical protein